MKFWKDLACTIPAQDGDKVAAMTPEKGEAFYQPDPTKRPVMSYVHSQMPMPEIDFGGGK